MKTSEATGKGTFVDSIKSQYSYSNCCFFCHCERVCVIFVYSSNDLMKQIIIYKNPFMFEAVIRKITDQREDKNNVRSFFFFSPFYSFSALPVFSF